MSKYSAPEIYVVSNNSSESYDEGKWIDITLDIYKIYQEVESLIQTDLNDNTSHWEICAIRGFDDLTNIYLTVKNIHAALMFIGEQGALAAKLYSHFNDDIHSAKDALTNQYCGSWDSETDFACHLVNNNYLNDLPHFISTYFNYEKYSLELFRLDYFSISTCGETHIFSKI